VNACTIIARNYLPHARVLAESFRAHHPSGSFTALVIDAEHGDIPDEPFAVLTPYDLGLERAEVHRMAFIYDIKEFATSLKPALLAHLLESSAEVAYFDPDIEIFAALDDIGELAAERGVVLTPHTTAPLPRDGLLPSEEMLLRAGIYNLGFIAVGQATRPFLEWWGERLRRDCIVAVEDGLFVDQRWIDFVPALFDHVVLRDTSCNVAYWNLSYRELARRDDRWEVDGNPLRFFHYSGFSPDRMHLLSAHMGSLPRLLLADQPDLGRLCDAYAARLRAHGFGAERDERYRFDLLREGLEIDPRVRRDVREALLMAERADEPPSPDPFDEAERFLEWLGDPVGDARVPRYLAALHRRRGDLRRAYPDLARADRRELLEWAMHSRREGAVGRAVLDRALPRLGVDVPVPSRAGNVEAALRGVAQRHHWLSPLAATYRALRKLATGWRRPGAPSEPARQFVVPTYPPLPGINLVGYLRAELGVGEAARRLARGLEAGGIPHTTTAYGRTASRQQHAFAENGSRAFYDTNVVCINADQLPTFYADAGPSLFEGRYTIGLWFWEVERFPASLHESFDFVDEVWTASEFVASAIQDETSKPVRVIPLPVEAPPRTGLTRADVGLPDGFVFLFCFDFLSVVERKNPHGLVEAFERAFAPGEGPTLVIKTINGDRRHAELALLERRTAHRDDIVVVDGYRTPTARDALIGLCDCYVSLHRSEGYGLTMAEAMALGKPVIATEYSGNLSFMDGDNSLLVPHTMVPVPAGCDPYPAGARWAEPDLDVAAELMRGLYERPAEARELGRRAQEQVLRRNGPDRTADVVARRLREIHEERSIRATDATRAPALGTALTAAGARRPTRIARRVLQRLLWPYLDHQRRFDVAVADALRAHEAALASAGEELAPESGRAEVVELVRSDVVDEPVIGRRGAPGG
jgi:glycosyltransferase involved in cell wall biosynthesis